MQPLYDYPTSFEAEQRNCFLVLWGQFTSQQEAESAIKGVPQYFWQQQSPPRDLELRPYL